MTDPWDYIVYLPTWQWLILYGFHVGKYTSPMESSWEFDIRLDISCCRWKIQWISECKTSEGLSQGWSPLPKDSSANHDCHSFRLGTLFSHSSFIRKGITQNDKDMNKGWETSTNYFYRWWFQTIFLLFHPLPNLTSMFFRWVKTTTYIIYIYTWNPNDLYFWRSTPQNKAFSNQNKGHLVPGM